METICPILFKPLANSAAATPPSLIVTTPELTAKLSELKDAAPLAEVVASAKFKVTVPVVPPPDKLVPAVTPSMSPDPSAPE